MDFLNHRENFSGVEARVVRFFRCLARTLRSSFLDAGRRTKGYSRNSSKPGSWLLLATGLLLFLLYPFARLPASKKLTLEMWDFEVN